MGVKLNCKQGGGGVESLCSGFLTFDSHVIGQDAWGFEAFPDAYRRRDASVASHTPPDSPPIIERLAFAPARNVYKRKPTTSVALDIHWSSVNSIQHRDSLGLLRGLNIDTITILLLLQYPAQSTSYVQRTL